MRDSVHFALVDTIGILDVTKRRRWSDDEKRMICAQTRVPGVSVSQVARRYNVNANQVFNWLKDARFSIGHDGDDAACFLPVEIVEPVLPEVDHRVADTGKIEIALAGGHCLSISGPYDPEALERLIRSLIG